MTACASCGLPVHRYSPQHPGSTDLMGCINSLRGRVKELEDAIRYHRDNAHPQGITQTGYNRILWVQLPVENPCPDCGYDLSVHGPEWRTGEPKHCPQPENHH